MTHVISETYRELNRQLHTDRPEYGSAGGRDAPTVVKLARGNGYKTILDYGCGKGTLKPAVAAIAPELTVLEFDPAIAGKDVLPAAAVDFVVALDVMEHIEPEYLDPVLRAIQSLTSKCVLMVVATRPAVKDLQDGRNAHLIVQPMEWWLERFAPFFRQAHRVDAAKHFTFIGTPVQVP